MILAREWVCFHSWDPQDTLQHWRRTEGGPTAIGTNLRCVNGLIEIAFGDTAVFISMEPKVEQRARYAVSKFGFTDL